LGCQNVPPRHPGGTNQGRFAPVSASVRKPKSPRTLTVRGMKPHTTTPRYLTLAEAAVYCSLSEKTLRRLIGRGELACYRPCRSVLLSVEDLDAFMEFTRVNAVAVSDLVAMAVPARARQ